LGAGYTLVICEKPDAALKVAEALSETRPETVWIGGVPAARTKKDGVDYLICSAQGHLYDLSDPFGERLVYPAFDVEWYPSHMVEKSSRGKERRILALREAARGATKFVNACDLDVEGETIGFNVLRYACGGREKESLRASFSTLAKDDLVNAFARLSEHGSSELARTGRARHLLDFLWGVNLSRVLSMAARSAGGDYRNVTVGRVQGPTLGFLVQREREVRTFVPIPHWTVSCTFRSGRSEFEGTLAEGIIRVRSDAERVVRDCSGKGGLVAEVRQSDEVIPPPPPFNIGDLLKESYRNLHLPLTATMRAAESLYLDALISYPRTESQKLPSSIDSVSILRKLGGMKKYSTGVAEALAGRAKPAEGSKSDSAHPAIHPTGEAPRRALSRSEEGVLDLVIRRFIATFGRPATRKRYSVLVAVGRHRFRVTDSEVTSAGWTALYGRYWKGGSKIAPHLSMGDSLSVAAVRSSDGFSEPPARYNQGSLLDMMEYEGVGTKATRPVIVDALYSRRYVEGTAIKVSELGFVVEEVLRRYSPKLVSPELTKEMEERLEDIGKSPDAEKALLRSCARMIVEQARELDSDQKTVGEEIDLAWRRAQEGYLGPCPVCREGDLRIVTSRKNRARFVGCSNYVSGCRASAPLPRGSVRSLSTTCEFCSWPTVELTWKGASRKLCVNAACPGTRRP
jgi:DNA topoisomerase I